MIAPPAPSLPGNVAPAESPEDGRNAGGTYWSRCGGSLMTWPPSRSSWSNGCTGSGSTSTPDSTGHAGSRVWTLLGHPLVLPQLALIAAGHAGLLPVVLRVVAWGG